MTQQLEMFSAGAEAAAGPGPAVKLRPYQEEAIESFYNLENRGENRFLLQLATGTGKTVVFSEYARRLGRPTLILAHRDELIQQAVAKLRAIWPGVDVGIVKAERYEGGHQVTVASVQTLSRERRFNMAFPDQAVNQMGLVVTDESHHSFASTYKSIYSRFGLMEKGGRCLHLGVTATPKRGDGKALDDVFDEIAYSMGIREGILEGFLSDLAGYTLTFANEDMAGVKISHGEYDAEQLEKAIKARANDWAQVRPEWGLANNAAFIVAPRTRSQHLNLAGRVFLHDYDHTQDTTLGVLELIMTAPMVVTNWINMQYYASVVDNVKYGSGNKVLHNVVGGRLGVFEGNGGDLRIGLPMQSLHDGSNWQHTPLRLSVFIEAPTEAIDSIIASQAVVRQLVHNQWLHLFQIDVQNSQQGGGQGQQTAVYRCTGSGWRLET